MYHALDMGISATDFWNMSARAVVTMQREMIHAQKQAIERRKKQQADIERGPRLMRLPRP